MQDIERLIGEAIERGEFDDLPGEGRPLPGMGESAGVWELTAKLLRAQGFSLPWIELSKEIDADLERARAKLAGRWRWYGGGNLNRAGWARATQAFAHRLDEINAKIRSYNLIAPLSRFQRTPLDLADELARLDADEGQADVEPSG